MASEDAVYRESSQYRLWSFSPAQLANLRAQTNELASTSIDERLRERAADEAAARTAAAGAGSPSAAAAAAAAALAALAYLTPAEEKLLLDFYTVELLRAGQFTEQPTDVQATAAVFFRRFYVTHSIMTYPPAALFKTALFFGAKSEGYYHKLDGFADKFPNTTAADILAGEFLLCQGIRFAFDVKHPFRALEGAVMELRRLADVDAERGEADEEGRISDSRVSNAHRRARAILKFSPLVTDAYFHYTPSQIMLAALWLADQGLVERLLLRETFHRPPTSSTAASDTAAKPKKKKSEAEWERVNGTDVRDCVMATVAACSALLATEPPERLTEYWGQPDSNNIIKPLLKKLKSCRDPDRFNLVALQQTKREGTVKSYARTAAVAAAAGDGDASVFGPNLGLIGGGAPEAKRRKLAKGLEDPFGPPLR